MHIPSAKTAFSAGSAIMGSILLSGCFLSPGQFEAALDIRESGTFSFTYDGEIVVTGMSDLAEMTDAAEMAEDCYDEDTFESRPCSDAELAERVSEQEQERAMMAAMMGGKDLSDPQAAEAFAANLERQAGWNSVVHLGDGLFDVDFAISSRITHDFAFPTIEGVPVSTAFITATLRKENRLRIDANGFAAQAGNPMQAMMMGGMALAGSTSTSQDGNGGTADLPKMSGRFTLVTDAAILANNTEEGPQSAPGGQMLVWDIQPTNTVAPTALLLLQP